MGKYKDESSKIKPLIKHYFKESASVLDIGLGHAEKIVPNAIGVDVRDCPNVDIKINPQDIYKLHEFEGFEKGFSIIFSSHCLEHLEDDKAALLSWSKMLRDDGIIILYLPTEDYYKEENPDHKQHYTMPKFIDKVFKVFTFLELVECFLDVGEERYSFCCVLRKKYPLEPNRYY
jgi:predicted SAM-dependent methyltransferase